MLYFQGCLLFEVLTYMKSVGLSYSYWYIKDQDQ